MPAPRLFDFPEPLKVDEVSRGPFVSDPLLLRIGLTEDEEFMPVDGVTDFMANRPPSATFGHTSAVPNATQVTSTFTITRAEVCRLDGEPQSVREFVEREHDRQGNPVGFVWPF